MITLFKILLIITLFLFFINNRNKLNKILEKQVILNLLLFAVSLFIKTEKEKKISFKTKFSKYISEKLLFFDLWILNYRSNQKSEKLFIKEDKRDTKGPNC